MEFDAWAEDALARGDVDALADYRQRAPGMPYAHPTVEHYVPLFVTLGAATDPERPGSPRSTATGWVCRSAPSRSPDRRSARAQVAGDGGGRAGHGRAAGLRSIPLDVS